MKNPPGILRCAAYHLPPPMELKREADCDAQLQELRRNKEALHQDLISLGVDEADFRRKIEDFQRRKAAGELVGGNPLAIELMEMGSHQRTLDLRKLRIAELDAEIERMQLEIGAVEVRYRYYL